MNQQPDELFRHKLEHYHKSPSPDAWKRISMSRHSRKNTLWLKIAASLVVPLLVGGYWLLAPSQKQSGTKQQPQIAERHSQPPRPLSGAEKEQTSSQPPAKKNLATDNIERQDADARIKKDQHISKEEDLLSEPMVIEEIVIAEMTIEESDSSLQAHDNYKLVIEADEANAKYLRKPVIAEATQDKKKSSGLKNLLDKAQAMDPYAELRQMKNEILALNFRDEKKSKENKQ